MIGEVLAVVGLAGAIAAEEYWRRRQPPFIPPHKPLRENEFVLKLIDKKGLIVHEVYSHSTQDLPDEMKYGGVTYYQVRSLEGVHEFEADEA